VSNAEGKKPLSHLIRFATQHPVKTLRRNHNKAIDNTGFGLGQLGGCLTFAAAVVGWLAYQYVVHIP